MLDKFAQDGSPLYLKFAFEEARHWRSLRMDKGLDPEVTGIIRQLLSRLSAETDHGPILVSRSLAYLRAAKNGLSEDEAIDAPLSGRGSLRRFPEALLFQAAAEPRLPVVVWSRFFFDLEPYLNERSADGTTLMGFFHRQMGEVGRADYLSGEDEAVSTPSWPPISRASLSSRLGSEKKANLRKLSELPFQQAQGGSGRPSMPRSPTSSSWRPSAPIRASSMLRRAKGAGRLYGGVYELIEDYRRALEKFPHE